MISILLLLCLGFLAQAEVCPKGGSAFRDKCYVLHTEVLNYHQARKSCHNSGTGLVRNIQDKAENDFIASIGQGRVFWIGLNKNRRKADKFLWINGSPIQFSFWGPHEPNNFKKNEFCVEFHSAGKKAWHYPIGAWNDETCSNKIAFMCQYPQQQAALMTGKNVLQRGIAGSDCPNDAKLYNGNCYQFVPQSLTWQSAADSCAQKGSSLVSNIKDQAENNFIASISGGQVIWIGVTKNGHVKKFKNVDGSEISYSFWGPHEPNNARRNEFCAELHSAGYKKFRYQVGAWNDNTCATVHPYICKFPKPEPAPIAVPIIPTYYDSKVYKKYMEQQNAVVCPTGGTFYNDNCYEFIPNDQNWQSAVDTCTNKGSSLVSNIKDKAENDFIAGISEGKVIWIGVTKNGHVKEFKNADGSQLTYNFWGPNEPNNFKGNEYCVEFYSAGFPQWNYDIGQWNDDECSNKKAVVCKRPKAQPAPATVEEGGDDVWEEVVVEEIIYE